MSEEDVERPRVKKMEKCRVCNGSGRIFTRIGVHGKIVEAECPTCQGSGKVNTKDKEMS